MKKKLLKLMTKQVLKVQKDKQSVALQYLQVNKLSKDIGILYFNIVQASSELRSYIKSIRDGQVRVLFKITHVVNVQ